MASTLPVAKKFIDQPALGKSDSHGIFKIAVDVAKNLLKTIEVSRRTWLCGIIFVIPNDSCLDDIFKVDN